MLWCFGSAALVALLLSLMFLAAHPLRLLARSGPGGLLRGCAAVICLLVALGLGALALLVGQ